MWVNPSDIVAGKYSINGSTIEFHPALRRSTCDYLAMEEWKVLEKKVNDGQASDAEVRKLLLKFIETKNKV
jgi:hypothetical protein